MEKPNSMSAMWVGERGKKSMSVGRDTKKRIMDGENVRDRAKWEKRTVTVVATLMIQNLSTLFIFISIHWIQVQRVWGVLLFQMGFGHKNTTVSICIQICVRRVSSI